MSQQLESHLQDVIKQKYGLELNPITLNTPPKKELWDVAFGTFPLAKELKKSPQDIATQLAETLWEDTSKLIKSVTADGPYVNIFVAGASFLWDFIELTQIPKNTQSERWTVIIDYIGANVGKPLHIWHMVTPSIWQVLVNAHKKLWYEVIADSHIGDWGIIFWKLITAYKKYGDEQKLHQDAVNHLLELYVQISKETEENPELEQEFRDTFKALSHWDEESKKLWETITRYSIDSMNQQLKRLNVSPDYDIGESFYEWIWLPKMWDYPDLQYNMNDIVQELIEKNIATQNPDGSVWVEFPEETKIPSCILQKRDGTHGYLASDLATIKYRMQNWDPDKIIYSVDVRQQLHLRQVFYISDAAGWTTRSNGEKTELAHAYNGFISLKDGAMSTRQWRLIKLSDFLDESESRAKKIILEKRGDMSEKEIDDTSEIIWIGAVKYGYLKKSRELDVVFDWDEFMSFEGNSGPYIQYSYVRAKNILSKAPPLPNIQDIDTTDVELSPDATSLMSEISAWKNILEKSMQTYHPHIIAQYGYNLAKTFNAFYNNDTVLNEPNQDLKTIKVFLTKEFASTIREVFEVLGIEMPEKM